MSGGSNFNHTVITSDGAGLVRRAQKEEKKLVFVKAVSSLKFENLRGDLVHKSREWFESIEGTVSAVQAKDGIFQIALSFKQAPSAVTLKSIGVMAKLVGDNDADAVVFAIASDDNSQFVVDTSSTSIVLVMDLPVRLNPSNCDSYGTIPGGGGGGGGEYVTPSQLEDAIEGCVASGEYDSNTHNIYLKNSDGTILSTIDASDFIVDGMVESVTIEDGKLIISFNTESGKEDIEIPISDIFDASNYYTKDECDQTFLTSSDLEGYALTSEIPTNLSELTNDVGYITSASLPAVNNAALTIKKNSDDVGTTFTANASSDVTANLGLHAVATSGSYTDLTDKPSIPTVNNATLTIQKNGTDVSTFTANASSDVTANITVPTNTSDLYNDSDFITSSALSDYALTSSLGSAAYKGVDTSISSSSTDNKVPTSLAVYSYIDAQGFLTQHQSLAGCVASGEYDSVNHNIYLKNSSNTVLSTIDCSAFIVDGMVEDVEIENGYLVISFNTDAGKQDISIPLTDIFNPANYYTKTECDNTFLSSADLDDYALKSEIPTATSDLTNDSGFITSADLSGYAQTADLGGAAYKGVDTSIGGSPTNDNVPTSLAVTTWVGNQGFLTSHQSLAGCVASGEYVSADHNILLKNSSGTVLSTIDASAFIKDGMVDTVAISNGYLVITFNTDAGKQPISIALSDIFDPSNYYTKTQVDSGFMTTGTDQLALTGRKTWASNIREDNVIKSSSMSLNPSDVANNIYPSIVIIREVTDTTTQESTAKRSQISSHGSMSVSYTSSTSDEYEPVPGGGAETYNPTKTDYSATLFADGGSTVSALSSTATSVVMEDIENPGYYTLETTEVKNISTLKPNSLKIEQTTKVDNVESLAKKTTELDNNHLNIEEDDSSGNTVKYAEFSPSEVEIQYLPGYKEASLSAANGELVITHNGSGSTNTTSLSVTGGLDVNSAITAHPTNGFKHNGSGGAYASLDATDGLKILGATGTTIRQIDKMGLLMGNLRVYWSDVPIQFKENNSAYEVVTYGSSAVVSKIKKTYVTQVYVYEENGDLKCSTQAEGSGEWSAYTVMDANNPKYIVPNRLQLIFDSSSKLSAVRLIGSITFSTLCSFKLLVPQSGSFSMIQGTLFVGQGSSNHVDYTLSTPVELAHEDLVICEAEFMPCNFIAPVDPE